MKELAQNYMFKLKDILEQIPTKKIDQLVNKVLQIKKNNKKIFICGNGGSAANAIHIANDLIFSKKTKKK